MWAVRPRPPTIPPPVASAAARRAGRGVAAGGAALNLCHLHQRLVGNPVGLRPSVIPVWVDEAPQPPLQRPAKPGQGAVLLLVADPVNEQDTQVVVLGPMLLYLIGHAETAPPARVPRHELAPG